MIFFFEKRTEGSPSFSPSFEAEPFTVELAMANSRPEGRSEVNRATNSESKRWVRAEASNVQVCVLDIVDVISPFFKHDLDVSNPVNMGSSQTSDMCHCDGRLNRTSCSC